MDAVADCIWRGLENLDRPAICTRCISDKLKYLDGASGASAIRLLRRDHHQLLSRIMTYVTSQPFAVDAEVRVEVVESCTCVEANVGDSGALISELSRIVAACLLSSRGLFTQRFGRSGSLWPTCIEELLPCGPKSSFDGLIYCFKVTPSFFVTGLLIGVLSYARYELMPLLFVEERRRTFVATFCRKLEEAASVQRSIPHGERWLGNRHECPASKIINIALLAQLIESGPGSEAGTWPRLVRTMEASVLAALDEARSTMKPHKFSDVLAVFAIHIYEAQGTPVAALPTELQTFAQHFARLKSDPYYRLFNQIIGVTKTVGCCMPGCGKHPRQLGPGGKLQRCRECMFVQYCSRECQKRHWKLASYPHKYVCARLKSLFAVAPFQVGPDGYASFILGCKAMLTSAEADRLAAELGPYVTNY